MKDPIGDRFKRYERAAKTSLPWRMPVVLRIDGRAFHTYTRGCKRPFDEALMAAMDACAIAVCEDAQGAVLAYVQSDEISVLLHPYRRLDSQPWFDNEVQKVVSISAAIAAATMTVWSPSVFDVVKPAVFDSRAFVLPEAEVCNYFIWRQQDAMRNAIQMAASALYSPKQLHKRNTAEMVDMVAAKGADFNASPTHHRRGRCIVRETFEVDGATRHRWDIDREIPVFTQDRAYVERLLAVESEAS